MIPGEWVEKWEHVLAALPASNVARVEEFDKMDALYYPTVAVGFPLYNTTITFFRRIL